jgi:hypothetical protein
LPEPPVVPAIIIIPLDPAPPAEHDILVTFVIDGHIDRTRLEGIIIPLPERQVIVVPNRELIIEDRADGDLNVTIKTRIISAIFEIVLRPVSSKEEPSALITGKIGAVRTHYQTRSLLTLQLDKNLIAGGASFSVENAATGAVLVRDQELKFGLFEGFSLLPSQYSAGDFLVSFFPFDSEVRAAFAYGPNNLTLNIDRPDQPIFSHKTVYIKDFELFELGVTTFGKNTDISKTATKRFSGWLSITAKPIVSTPSTVLSTGMPSIINH